MLETLKEMQKLGIFNIIPNDNLNNIIEEANDIDDIKDNEYNMIQMYLKRLNNEYSNKHLINLSDTISDFVDKFSYEIFDIAYTGKLINNIYQKETSFDNGTTNGLIGLSGITAPFSLDERKLLKLINHYYISLSNDKNFNDGFVYIPMQSLRKVFNGKNLTKVKNEIIETCNSLNQKIVYWDLRNTKISNKKGLDSFLVGQDEKLVNIVILYQPRKDANGKNGEANVIKGIFCNITSFMQLRKTLNQISNRFSVKNFNSNYLAYNIAEKIDYRLYLIYGTKISLELLAEKLPKTTFAKKHKQEYKFTRNLKGLSSEMFVCKKGNYENRTYFNVFINDDKSKESIMTFLDAILIAVKNLCSIYKYKVYFKVANRNVPVYKIVDKKREWYSIEKIYDGICSDNIFNIKSGMVKKYITEGAVELIIEP